MKPSSTFPAYPAAAFLLSAVTAQPLKEVSTTITRADATHWQLVWAGEEGYTFFPQISPGHDLMSFTFLPIAGYISGAGMKSFVVEGDPAVEPNNFWRLRYTTLDPANLSGDGIPAIFKINTLRIDPFAPSGTGTNGLSDAWEAYFFGVGNVDQVNPSAVLQPDGLTNKERSELGLDPNVNYNTASARAQYQYDLTGRLIEVTAPLIDATYTPDEEGNLQAQ